MQAEKNENHQSLKKEIKNFLDTVADVFLPAVSIDHVILSFDQEKLRVLLFRYFDMPSFSLPSGYIRKDEALDDAAVRILKEDTGLSNVYLQQFYTAGSLLRNNDPLFTKTMEKMTGKLSAGHWLTQRFVSVCYYALTDEKSFIPKTEFFISEAKWFDVSRLPKMLYDHKEIVGKALDRLELDLDQNHVGRKLITGTFTMNELQALYEAVYRRKLSRPAFQRKILSLHILERLEKKHTGKAHKSPYLYRFKKRK